MTAAAFRRPLDRPRWPPPPCTCGSDQWAWPASHTPGRLCLALVLHLATAHLPPSVCSHLTWLLGPCWLKLYPLSPMLLPTPGRRFPLAPIAIKNTRYSFTMLLVCLLARAEAPPVPRQEWRERRHSGTVSWRTGMAETLTAALLQGCRETQAARGGGGRNAPRVCTCCLSSGGGRGDTVPQGDPRSRRQLYF